jgi:DNA-binding GntR family transcriptional regulator
MHIADYIKSDLTARLKSDADLPFRLTTESLAEHYGVSFTPVRKVLAQLIHEGLLRKGENRRLQIGSISRSKSRKHAAPPRLPDDPFEKIANELVKMSLAGEAVTLREEATADKYRISRSSIRNILHRLAGEGILDHIPRRGWRLRPFRQDDLKSFIEVRELLELKAFDLARPKIDDARIRQMLDANVLPDSPSGSPQVDESFHEYLIGLSGNVYIKDFLDRQGRYYQLLFRWEDQARAVAIQTVRQHRQILEAILAHDWPVARKALSHHILNNHPILSQIPPTASSMKE